MTSTTTDEARAPERPWVRHLLLVVGLSLLVLVLWLLAVTLVPRVWAQFLTDRIDGQITVGTAYGLSIGFLFTLVPLLVARQAVREMAWRMRSAVLALAAVLAQPNLLTLIIVLGQGDGAHAGDRILDVDGPGFRVASALGALGAAVVFGLYVAWVVSRRRDRRVVARLEERASR